MSEPASTKIKADLTTMLAQRAELARNIEALDRQIDRGYVLLEGAMLAEHQQKPKADVIEVRQEGPIAEIVRRDPPAA